MISWILAVFLLFLSLLKIVQKKLGASDSDTPKAPPGPWKLPLLGHLLFLGFFPHEKMLKWKEKYGPIIFLQFGSYPAVPLEVRHAFGPIMLSYLWSIANVLTSFDDDGYRGFAANSFEGATLPPLLALTIHYMCVYYNVLFESGKIDRLSMKQLQDQELNFYVSDWSGIDKYVFRSDWILLFHFNFRVWRWGFGTKLEEEVKWLQYYSLIELPTVLTDLEKPLHERKLSSKVFKTRELNCTVAIYLFNIFDSNENLTVGGISESSDRISLNKYRISWVLGTDSWFYFYYYPSLFSILPLSALIVTTRRSNVTTEVQNVIMQRTASSFRYPSLPPVFILIFDHQDQTSGDEINCNVLGYFYCWYCTDLKHVLIEESNYYATKLQNISFVCQDPKNCYQIMMGVYSDTIKNGRSVVWRVATNTSSLIPLAKTATNESPFQIKNPLSLRNATRIFALRQLNLSFGDWNVGPWDPTAAVFTKGDEFLHIMGDKILIGRTHAYKFITPDRVFQRKLSASGIYLSPLESSLWYVLLGLSAFIVMLMILVSCFSKEHRKWSPIHIVIHFIWIFCAFLEQSRECHEGRRKESGTFDVHSMRFRNTVFGAWLLMIVILVNGYKGALKSDFSLDFPFETEWKSLYDLKNFTLYMPIGDCEKNSTALGNLVHGSSAWWEHCHEQNDIPADCKFIEQLNTGYPSMMKSHGRSINVLDWFLSQTYDFEKSIRQICHEEIGPLMQRMENGTKIAFVIVDDELDYTWGLIQSEISKRRIDLKLGHNKLVEENYLRNLEGWTITEGLNQYHQRVPRSLKVLMTSGIHWLWKRWDTYWFSKYSRPYRGDNENPKNNYKALSLNHSGIQILLRIFFIGMSFNVPSPWKSTHYSPDVKLRQSVILALSFIIIGDCQFRRAGRGEPCKLYDDPFTPGESCDDVAGLSCQEGNPGDFRCDCYEDWIHDPGSNECRIRMGYYCQPERNATIYEARRWTYKCQSNATHTLTCYFKIRKATLLK
ncbi:unnamed protein product [Allacma fusca]|uniref:Uncharacterized protein n=1 Tax=Allacma fusca TaxID=39272 RepID=A0A8J2KE88_9HEXA|nr:unnamed protein product [Allacma fusca]